jgi:hypothetical protein
MSSVFTPTATVYDTFNTFDPATGAPITLAGSPVLRLERIRAGVRTELLTDGITLRVDEDDTGRHEFDLDLDGLTSAAEAGDEYRVAFNAGTVDGNSVVGASPDCPNNHFFVEADALTAQQKADVNAEVDTALTDYDAATGTELSTHDTAIKALLPAALIGGRMESQVNAMAGGVISAGTFAANAVDATALAADAVAEIGVETAAELATFFGIITGAVATDGGNSETGFEVDTDVSTDVRKGMLRLTSGALSGESCLVSWTGTAVTVLSQTSMPTALKQFSATPADGVTFSFTPF